MARVKPHVPKVDAFSRQLARLAATRPGTWFYVNAAPHVDRVIMPLSKGRVRMTGLMPSLLLIHRGARTGLERTTPLLYFSVGDDVVLVASKGGAPKHPAWYHNVRHQPMVRLSDGANTGPYVGREAEGPERDGLWEAACRMYPGYDAYQRRTTRRIPVLVFSPAEGP